MGQGVQEWTKQNLWKAAFKKFELVLNFPIFQMLSSTNFTWSIHEYLDPYAIVLNFLQNLFLKLKIFCDPSM